tara:strand:+ start:166 stop:759 length:594 start_codon:yes stop_codon:yes gene_type:complete
MTQITKSDEALIGAMQNTLRAEIAPVHAKLDSLDQRLTAVEKGGTAHAYTAQTTRGVEAQVSPLFGVEIPAQGARSGGRVVSEGEALHARQLLTEVKRLEDANKALKGTGRKHFLWVSGTWDKDAQVRNGKCVSMYTLVRDAVFNDSMNGAKLATEQKSLYERVLVIAEELDKDGLRKVDSYNSATSAVKKFLKDNC